jgi:hypothetical protein
MGNVLREADKPPVAELAKSGVSRRRFGVMSADEMKQLEILNTKNARLKKIVAEGDLELEAMKEIAAKNGERVRAP